jgi:hypothetical protein
MRTRIALLAVALLGSALSPPAMGQEPSAAELMTRVGAYAAGYGEKSSVVVAVETYTQQVTVEGAADVVRPIKLVAEFAIVKLAGGAWTGFRDVLEVNGQAVQDRKDRLASLLTGESASISEATRIANESARFNVGPISRNINTPTAALFFFMPQNLERFSFTKKGAKTIDSHKTVEIAFKETTLPTLITTRAGRNVPLEGSLWVAADGTVIRTRMRVERFADGAAVPDQTAPRIAAPTNAASNGGGRQAGAASSAQLTPNPIDSSADIEVTYAKPAGIDLWLPAQMVELYEGPINIRMKTTTGRSSTRASYANFKQFGASGKIVPQ